tara:strand:- start:2426 stop:2662 length:237 start_codon:yes stop_codon:yes gene_type:complete
VTREERKKLDPRYTNKIMIIQKLDHRGRSKFFIMHKPTRFSRPNYQDVPKYDRVRYSLDAAETVAFKLIKNYEKYFMY